MRQVEKEAGDCEGRLPLLLMQLLESEIRCFVICTFQLELGNLLTEQIEKRLTKQTLDIRAQMLESVFWAWSLTSER